MTKQEALEKYLGVEVKQGYDDDTFETEDAEYKVFTEAEADEATKDYIESFIDDAGIEGFTPEFQDWIYENAVDEDFFYDIVKEDIENYVYDTLDYDKDRMAEEAIRLDIVEEGTTGEDLENDDLYSSIQDELAEKLFDEVDDYVGYIEDNFGKEEVARLVKETNSYDIQKIVDECIKWDGRGHFLAGYDGAEHELADEDGYIEYYAYQTN
jgi:hypothetical protein